MVNAKDMIRRLREERKAKNSLSKGAQVIDAGTAKHNVSQALLASATAPSDQQTQQKLQLSIMSASGKIWQEESLFERCVVLKEGTTQEKNLRLLEDPMGKLAGGNGATLWDCSVALTHFLTEHYKDECLSHKTVLELGAGLGLVGMAMAATTGASVVTTERELALPLLRKNVAKNEATTSGRVESADLSWGKETTEALLAQRERMGLQSFDIVVGSDLVFPSNVEAYSALADTIFALLHHHQQRGAVEMWQSHEPRRPEVEAAFWTMLEERGILVQQLSAADGLPASHPSDILILRLTLELHN